MRCVGYGASMLPFLRDGDAVYIVRALGLRIGDIVLVEQKLHRVVAKWNGQVITKGDANARLDTPVDREQMQGRAVARERRGRVRRLDRLGTRFLGLAWCLTSWIPGLLSFLAATRRTLRNVAGLPTLKPQSPQPNGGSRWAPSLGTTAMAGTASPASPQPGIRI
jgi:hypothetical protein